MAKLTKRPGKNNYEIAFPLPAKLRPILGTPALYRSLGTPDKAEAKRQLPFKLAEVQVEVAALLAKHFPDDTAALSELQELLSALKGASDEAAEGGLSEKDIILDAAIEWGTRQRMRRLQAYRGTPEFERQKQLARDIEAGAGRMVLDAVDPRIKIADLIDKWRADEKPRLSESTREEYERTIGRFLKWSQAKHITTFDQVSRKAVREFVSDTFHGKMGRTVKLALGAMRGVWKHARTIGWIDEEVRVWLDHNYADNVRIGTGEAKGADEEELPFTFADIRALLPGVQPRAFCDVFRLGLITGARSSEIAALRPEHLTLEEDGYWLSLPGTKSKSARRLVPVPTAYRPLMERLASDAAGTYLLPLYPGKTWETERDRNRYINKEVNRKRRELKLPQTAQQGVHSTRRTYSEVLEGAEVPLHTVKLLIGHSRRDITFGRYSKGMLVDLRGAVERLEYPADIVALINQGESSRAPT